jgi:hypothetical protein
MTEWGAKVVDFIHLSKPGRSLAVLILCMIMITPDLGFATIVIDDFDQVVLISNLRDQTAATGRSGGLVYA